MTCFRIQFAVAVALVLSFLGFLAPSQVLSSAQASPATGSGDDGLPGVFRTDTAEAFEPGPGLTFTSSYGYTGAALERNDSHYRAAARAVAVYAFSTELAMALRADGRYDKHFLANGNDDGWIAEPRLMLRYRREISKDLAVGVQLGLWSPGGFSALSAELVAALTWTAPDGKLKISGNFGHRQDRSAAAIDNPELLSASDRLSLGLSDFNAMIAYVGAQYSLGSVELLGEVGIDLLHGKGAPETETSPSRVSLGARYLLPNGWYFFGHAEYVLSEPLSKNYEKSLVVVDPRLSAFAGLQVRFGVAPPPPTIVIPKPVAPANPVVIEPPPPELGAVRGVVSGQSETLAGAQIVVVDVNEKEFTTMTDETGTFILEEVALGAATLKISAEGYETREVEATVTAEGVDLAVSLEKVLPPGVLRGYVRSFSGGKALRALLTVEPGNVVAESEEDGYFYVELAPGEYHITITAEGYVAQEKDVEIGENSVVFVSPNLRKAVPNRRGK